LLRKANNNPYVQAQLKEICKRDPLFYLNTFVFALNAKDHAKHPVRLFISHEYQDEAVVAISDAFGVEDLCVAKSRDMGGTQVCISTIEWAWHFLPYQSFLICSRNEDLVEKTGDTKTLYFRLDFIHKHQPAWLLPTGREKGPDDPNRIKKHLKNEDNGSVIDGEATTGDLSVGDKRTAIFLDERGLMDNGAAISLGTREATRCRISNSTPRGTMGTGKEFYDIFKNPYIKNLVLPWWRHPDKGAGLYTSFNGQLVILDKTYEFPEDYDFILDGEDCLTIGYDYLVNGERCKVRSPHYDHETRRTSSKEEIAQEFDLDFLSTGWPFFDAQTIQKMKAKYCREAVYIGELQFDMSTVREAEFEREATGRLSLWLELIDGKPPVNHSYCVGADIATGIGGEMSSNSTLSVFDKTMGEKVAEFACRHTSPEKFAEYAMALGHFFNGALLIPESNGPGGQFLKVVMEEGYPNLYYRGDELSLNKRKSLKPGWASTKDTKKLLLGAYRKAVLEGLYPNPSVKAMDEAAQYKFSPNGVIEHDRAHGDDVDPASIGEDHGDRVIADALSWRGSQEVRVERAATPDAGYPVGSFGHRQKLRQQRARRRLHY